MARYGFSYRPGAVIGCVEILSRPKKGNHNGAHYDFRCTRCSHMSLISHGNLKASQSRKGCVKCRKVPDLVGRRFGRLVVKAMVNVPGKRDNLRWECVCDCGAVAVVKCASLLCGKTKSCGCLKRETQTTHGMSRHALYAIYNGIIGRCTNPKHGSYGLYGGRGISLDPSWISNPLKFIEDVTSRLGERPSEGHSLDRIDNDVGYFIHNLRWSTQDEQVRNRRVTLAFLSDDKSERISKVFSSLADLREWVLREVSPGLK